MAGLTAASPFAAPERRYARAFDIAVVFVVGVWHIVGAGGQLMSYRAAYSSDTLLLAAWIALALAIIVGSVRLLGFRTVRASGSGQSAATAPATADQELVPTRASAWVLAGSGLVLGAVVAAMCPAGAMLKTDWGWGTAGWVAVLALLRRPLRELCVFLVLNALTTLAFLVRDGLHRLDLAAFLIVLVGSVSIQIAVGIAASALDTVARQAADAAKAEAAAREAAAIAELIDSARRARMHALRETAGSLIHGLAVGSADPGDAEVRRKCAVEAARLRRLMAESDDTSGPLLHELHASAETAVRSGIAVDIEAAGVLPDIPAGVRRVMTDTVIAMLASAHRRARITVTAFGETVALSVVADALHLPERHAPYLQLPATGDTSVVISTQRDDLDHWVEARWTAQ